MPTKHMAFDEELLFWDADATLRAAATYHSAVLSLSDLGLDGNSEKHYGVAISWPGVDSAGAATTLLSILSDDTATPTAVIWEDAADLSLAETKARYQDAERCVLPIPMLLTGDNIRLQIDVDIAALTAGTITAGLVPLE